MNIEQTIDQLKEQFEVLGIIDLDISADNYDTYQRQIEEAFRRLWRPEYTQAQRILVKITNDEYRDGIGIRLKTMQMIANKVDVSNPFIIVVSTNPNLAVDLAAVSAFSTDSEPMHYETVVEGVFNNTESDKKVNVGYQYGSSIPTQISLDQLTDREKFLLTESETFCIYPWVHIHAYPTGEAYPCCHAEMKYPVGNCREKPLKDIWRDHPMQHLREDMLEERKNSACARCYEQEEAGFFSGRKSANKHHGHHIKKIDLNPFELTYWDIRFSNLCNLSCRSCGHIFSSSWYQDQARLAGGDWKQHNKPLNYAGRHETDMWEQLEPHLDYVEQIYFAGGEPLLMEEHYNILEELVQRERFDVRLIYNTNFTHTQLKDRSVFEYWKLFNSVAVGASLDADGPRAEYIRKGTDWEKVEANRVEMMRVCPNVDFYISPTLSIMNALHLPDFHRLWVEVGLIKPQDLNVNILQDPAYYRIDIATPAYKDQLREKYLKHLEWLRPQDPLQRATVGFESAIKFMDATDNSHLLPEFWSRTKTLDALRNENVLHALPELIRLK